MAKSATDASALTFNSQYMPQDGGEALFIFEMKPLNSPHKSSLIPRCHKMVAKHYCGTKTVAKFHCTSLQRPRLSVDPPSWFSSCPWSTRGNLLCCAAPCSTASNVSCTRTRKGKGRSWPRCSPPPSTVSHALHTSQRLFATLCYRGYSPSLPPMY